MNKTLFFILIIVFTIHKSKADVCDNQADDTDIAANVLEVLRSPFNWKPSASNKGAPQKNKKLDKILNKLGDIQDSISKLSSVCNCLSTDGERTGKFYF